MNLCDKRERKNVQRDRKRRRWIITKVIQWQKKTKCEWNRMKKDNWVDGEKYGEFISAKEKRPPV